MRQDILNRIAAITTMASVPSYARELARLEGMIEDQDLELRLENLGGGGLDDDSSRRIVELEKDVERFELNGGAKFYSARYVARIYIDSLAGDDGNDGRTAARAIKTWGELMARYNKNEACDVYVNGELLVDAGVRIWGRVNNLFFRGSGDGAALRFVDTGQSVGGLEMSGGGHLGFSNISLIDDRTRSKAPIYGRLGAFYLRLHNVTVSRGAKLLATGKNYSLVDMVEFCVLMVSGVVIEDSANGQLIRGFAPGDDLNGQRRLVSNASVI